MLQVKRWAKQYLMLSPIFQHNVFSLPNNEHIMRVNPRLLSAYCLRMFKYKHYNHTQITNILQLYNPQSNCYWNHYVHSIIDPQYNLKYYHIAADTKYSMEQSQQQHSIEQILQLRHLIAKTFHQQISRQQFSQLAQLYLSLLDQNSISQMDNYAIDLSLFKLEHIVAFADMKESALPAIDSQSIWLLQNITNKSQPAYYFSVISVLLRLGNKLDSYPHLRLLSQLIRIQSNHKQLFQRNSSDRVFLSEQSIVFMVWLLHIHQLAQFVYTYLRKNYLLIEYHEHSLQLIARLLNLIEVDHSMQQQHVVLLSQIVSRVHLLHQQSDILEQFEQNLQLQKTLNRLKNKINQLSHKHPQTNSNNQPIQLLQQLNRYQIDFCSTYSHKLIKQQLVDIVADPHSAILLTHPQIDCLFELSHKIDSAEMQSKLSIKFKNHILNRQSRKLIDYLIGLSRQSCIGVTGLSIDNICQLRRVKQYLSGKSTALNKLKLTQPQIVYLKQLQVLLGDPSKYSSTIDPELLSRALGQLQL